MINGEDLAKMSLEDLSSLYSVMKQPTQEQKEIAWKKMDIGIYDPMGNLIGDMFHEDKYENKYRGLEAIKEASRIANENGISDMTLDEINSEIYAVRERTEQE